MAYTFRSATSAGNASGGAVTVNKPSGVVDGDLLIVAAYLESDTNTWTPGSGFTSLATQANTGLFVLQVWYKWASSEPASWTWTPASSNWRAVVCAAWSGGAGSGNPFDVSAGAQGDGDIVANQLAPSVTTTAADDLLLFVYGNYAGSSPGDTTGTATDMRVTLGGLTIGDATIASAGSTGTSGPDSAVGTEDWAAIHLALFSGASGPASVSPTGIASAEAFGTPTVGTAAATIEPAGIAAADAYGAPSIVATLSATGIASAEAIGAPAFSVAVSPSAISSGEAFGVPTVGGVPASIEPTGIASEEAHGSPALGASVAPTGISASDAYGQPTLFVVVSASGVSSAEAFGTPTISGAAATISPASISASDAYGSPSISAGIGATGFADPDEYGTPVLSVSLVMVGVDSAEAFGVPFLLDPAVGLVRASATSRRPGIGAVGVSYGPGVAVRQPGLSVSVS